MTRRAERIGAGFTLIELTMVLLIVATLTGMAYPRLSTAIHKADAAKIVTDVGAIRLAVIEYVDTHGAPPGNSGWGRLPADLEDHLPDGFSFEYKEAEYRWRRGRNRGVLGGSWGAVYVRYPRKGRLSDAMRTHRSGTVLWNQRRTIFLVAK